MKKIGFVDQQGDFCLKIIYRIESSWDMEQMSKILNEYEDAFVESYDDEEVRVVVRPDW